MTYLEIFKEVVLTAGHTPDEADRRIANIKAHDPKARAFFSREIPPEQVPHFQRAALEIFEAIDAAQRQDPVAFAQRADHILAEVDREKFKN